MTRITWTEQALADLTSIRDFIGRDAPGYAEATVDRVFESVERLASFPLSGRIVPELENESIREIILGAYRVVYRIQPSEVSVLTVFHSARLFGPSDLPGT